MPKVMMSRDMIWKLVIDGLYGHKESDRDNKMVIFLFVLLGQGKVGDDR